MDIKTGLLYFLLFLYRSNVSELFFSKRQLLWTEIEDIKCNPSWGLDK